MRPLYALLLVPLVGCSKTPAGGAGRPDATVVAGSDASVGGAGGGMDGAMDAPGQPTGAADAAVDVAPDASNVGDTAGTPPTPGLYTPGSSSFVVSAGEQHVMVDVASDSVADAQAQIDAARMASPAAVIVARLSGTYLVTSAPLRLPSSTCLLLSGILRAAPDATAPALLLIDGQTKVSVSGGTLDGSGAALDGIRVQGSRKVAIDGVVVRNTGGTGIAFAGPGATVWDGGSTLTRVEVGGAGAGIVVQNATQVLVIDGFLHDNAGAGITFGAGAAFGAIVHNRASGNAVGIAVDGADNAISDNSLNANGTAIRLGPASANNACLQNVGRDSTSAGINLDGTNNLVYANALTGSAPALISAGTTNSVVPDDGAPLAPGDNRFFYPPTLANPHADPTIVTGKGRTDVTVNGGTMSDVQLRYDEARAAHPNDVIVLHLQGAFTEPTAPFTLSSFTAIVLDGTIDVTASIGPAITGEPGLQFASFSGGTIDAHNRVMEGLSFDLGSLVVLDHVSVKNFGLQSPRSPSNSIRMQRGSGYSIIRGCHVDVSGGRAIWTENSTTRFIVVGNTVSHANMDGIDFDAHTTNSLAKDNVSDGNTRSGIFIEEGAAFNKAYANTFSNTSSHGINLYSNVAGKSTHQNLAFCNAIAGNRGDGVRIGAINGNTTSDTFLFNNVITDTAGPGLRLDAVGTNNYCAANVLRGNTPDVTVDPTGGADFFNAPTVP